MTFTSQLMYDFLDDI